MGSGSVSAPEALSITAIDRADLNTANQTIRGTCPYEGEAVLINFGGLSQSSLCSQKSWSVIVDTLSLTPASYTVIAETRNPSNQQVISATLDFTRVNLAPALDAIADVVGSQSVAITTIDASDGGDDFDSDSEAITYSCFYDTVVNFSVASSTACTGLGGVSFDPATGVFNWTPAPAQVGSYEFKIVGSDGSLSDEELFSVVVNNYNQSPVLNAIADQTVNENIAITTVNAGDGPDDTDVDGQALTYSCYYDSLVNGAVASVSLCTSIPGLSFDASTGVMNWTPSFSQSGTYEFRIIGSDGMASDDELFSITVTDVQAAKLSFSMEPSNSGTAGVALSTQPRVSFLSSTDVVVTNETAAVVLGLYTDSTCTTLAASATNSGDPSLEGTLTQASVNGVTSFTNIKINLAGNPLYLRASSGSLTTDCSVAMNISPGAYSLSRSELSVSGTTVNSGSALTVTLTGRDAFGNANPSGIGTVTFDSSLVGGTGSFGSRSQIGPGRYAANFTGLLIGSVTLSGLINTASITDTETVTVNPGVPASISIVSGNNQVAPAATQLALDHVVLVRDAQTNVVPGVQINWSVVTGGGNYPAPTSTTNAYGTTSNRYTTGSTGINTSRATINSTAISVDFTTSSGTSPVISNVTDKTSVGSLDIPFTITDAEDTLVCATAVSGTSSTPSVLTASAISISGTAPNCIATLTKNPTEIGATTITLTVTDGTTTAQDSFVVTFSRGWYQEAYIKASNPSDFQYFGDQLSLSGDTLAVSAPIDNSSQSTITNGTTSPTDTDADSSGAVFVYKRTGVVWAQEAYIKASNNFMFTYFGSVISLSGDTLVVGTTSEDGNQNTITNGTTSSTTRTLNDSGAVYVYRRTGTVWAQEAYVKASNADSSDFFGNAISVSGDSLAVGAPSEDGNLTTITNGETSSSNNLLYESGAVYVYHRTGSIWVQEAYIKASNANNYDSFGEDVSLSGDTLTVGAYDEDSGQTTITNGQTASADNSKNSSGAVYVYRRSNTLWTQEAYIKPSNSDDGDGFGSMISLSGDTLAVGVEFEDSNQLTITNGPTASADNSFDESGAAYVFRRAGSSWTQEAYIKAPNAEDNDSFGYSLALSGDTLVIGAIYEDSSQTTISNGSLASSDNSAPDLGAGYVFKRTGSTWALEAYIKPSNGDADHDFGWATAASGDTIAIAADEEDSTQNTITNGHRSSSDTSGMDTGAVYVYRNSSRLFEAGEFIARASSLDSLGLSWQTAGLKASGYKLAYNTGTTAPADCNSGTVIDVGNVTSYNLTNLLEDTSYSFRICSYDIGANTSAGLISTFRTRARMTISDTGNLTKITSFSIPVTVTTFGWSSTCPLALSASSSDTSVVAPVSVSFSGVLPNCIATFTKDPKVTGSSTITLTVSDGVRSIQDSFILTYTSGWYQEAYIKAPNVDANDYFGNSVSLSGDTLLVSAIYEDSNQTTITNGSTASANNSLSNSGAAYVFKRTGSTWFQQAYLKAPNANADDLFSYSTSLSGDTLTLSALDDDSNQTTITNGTTASADNSAASAGSVFVFKRTGNNWAQEAYIKASNAQAGDAFGISTSVNGNTIVVGAWAEDSNQTTVTNGTGSSSNNTVGNSGAAYVYRRNGTSWTQEAYLKAPNPDVDDLFGFASSVNGDTIAVSARGEDSGQTTITNGTTASADNTVSASGAVYVYRRTNVSWVQEAYIKPPSPGTNDYFGYSVSLSGDTLAVGSPYEDSNQSTITNGATASADNSALDSGAAFVYKRNGSTWTQEAYIKTSNAETNDNFGISVSLAGNILAVGAFNESSDQNTITNGSTASASNAALYSGAIYIFKRTGTTWAQEAYIKAPNTRTSLSFGVNVSLSGDSIAVGTFNESSNQSTITNGETASSNTDSPKSGAVYVYRNSAVLSDPGEFYVRSRATDTLSLSWQAAGIKAVGYKIAYNLGTTAPADCNSGTVADVGNVLNYSFSSLMENQVYSFRICSYDSVGTLSAGYTASFRTTAAPVISNVPNTTSVGGLTIPFTITDVDSTLSCTSSVTRTSSNTGVLPVASIVISGTAPNCVATITKSPTQTGTTTITLSVSDGSAVMFDIFDLTFVLGWYQEAFLKAPNSEASDQFGHSVAISGDTVVVGAPFEDSNQITITNGTTASGDNTASNSGAAYVFKRTGSTWAQEAYVKASNAGASDYFGWATSISGDTLVVTALYEASAQSTITNGTTSSPDNSLISAGAAYVYRRAGSTWAQEAYLKTSNMEMYDLFGDYVSISGDTIAVGAQGESSNETTITNGPTASANNDAMRSGAVYIFKRTGTTWIQEAYIKASNAEFNDFFRAVSLNGDTLSVGAHMERSNETTITNGSTSSADNSAASSGATYVYRRSGVTWAQEAYIKASNADIGDGFGFYTALSADTLVVGAPSESSNQTTISSGVVASSDNSLSGAGAVYVFKRTGVNWAQEAYIKASNAGASDRFSTVAINGDTIVVGASYEDSGLTTIINGAGTPALDDSKADAGAIYIYKRSGSLWTQDAAIKAANSGTDDEFGDSVSISGDTVVVGARMEDSTATTITNGYTASTSDTKSNSGAVYVYRNSGRLFWAGEIFVVSTAADSVTLKWTTAGQKATGYKVTYQPGDEAPADCSSSTDVGNSLTHAEGGLSPSTEYTFKVCAYDGVTTVNGPWITVTTP